MPQSNRVQALPIINLILHGKPEFSESAVSCRLMLFFKVHSSVSYNAGVVASYIPTGLVTNQFSLFCF
jgi:hypothetical protein